jgi:hypothetical protein
MSNNNKEINQAPEETLEKSLAIAEIFGVDTSKYNIKLELYRQGLFLNSLPEENVHYAFKSSESNLNVSYNYIEGKLHSVTASVDGQPQTNRPITSNFEMAQDFLNKYQTFSGAPHYSKMISMLKDVEPDRDTTVTSGNIKLQVTQIRNITEIRWTYIVNDIEVPVKNVGLYFEQGFLKYFVDKWDIYKIGSDKIALLEKEAIEIAKSQAKEYTWNAKIGDENKQVKLTEGNIAGGTKTQLNFENSPENKEARNGGSLTLYPSWRIQLNLDDLYPGNVYGLEIRIWADTKEVYSIETMTKIGNSSSG